MSQQHTPRSSPKLYTLRVHPMRAAWAFCCGRLCGSSGRLGWPLVWLLPDPAFLQRLPAIGRWGWVTKQLTAEPHGLQGLCWLTGGQSQGPENSGPPTLGGKPGPGGYSWSIGRQSCVLESGCRTQESQSWHQIADRRGGGEGCVAPDTARYRVWGVPKLVLAC